RTTANALTTAVRQVAVLAVAEAALAAHAVSAGDPKPLEGDFADTARDGLAGLDLGLVGVVFGVGLEVRVPHGAPKTSDGVALGGPGGRTKLKQYRQTSLK